MSLATGRPGRKWLRPFGLVLAAALLAGACSGAAATLFESPSPTPEGSPTPTPVKGPPAAQLSFSGDPALSSLTDVVSIKCNFPTLGGSVIILSEQGNAGGLAVRVVVSQGSVVVQYSSGSGKSYVERDFTGSGVSGFDPSAGAQIDSVLDAAVSATATGNLGTIVSMTGSVDCGNQGPGTSTLTMTGGTAQGLLNGAILDPVRVECTVGPNGNSVQIVGATLVESVPTIFTITATAAGYSVIQQPRMGQAAVYSGRVKGSVTLTDGGVHIAGPATAPATAGASPFKLTVTGDATCGSTVGG